MFQIFDNYTGEYTESIGGSLHIMYRLLIEPDTGNIVVFISEDGKNWTIDNNEILDVRKMQLIKSRYSLEPNSPLPPSIYEAAMNAVKESGAAEYSKKLNPFKGEDKEQFKELYKSCRKRILKFKEIVRRD